MESFTEFFEENPPIAKRIVTKSLEAQQARNAAKKAKALVRRKNAFSVGGLPGKLADCSSNKTEESELYIVEGDSAGGCFSGNIEIALADGRNVSFKDLVKEYNRGKKNFCYTIKKDGSIGIESITNPRITKTNAEVIRIILDNEKDIICTPNHKFMLRNGDYKEAKNLTKEDSLMPLNKKISKIEGRITIDGYEMVWDPRKEWIFTQMLTKTLHRADIKQKAAEAHKSPEYKEKMSAWAKQPEVKEMLSNRAKEQWKDDEYKKYMAQKFIEFYDSNEDYQKQNSELLNKEQKKYWSNQENRKKAAEKVKKFFEENPDAKEYLSSLATEQWKDEALIIWRRQKTREQWTPEFREKRKIAYNDAYFRKTVYFMKKVIENEGSLNNFDKLRIENNDKTILSSGTFCLRFFNNNSNLMIEAVQNYNHKIKSIEKLSERINVYDIEVPNTHNFALASGIFVHNSAKMARNKEFQAILPLKGKP